MTTQHIYKAYNSLTRKHEEIDPDAGEFFHGDTMIKLFYSAYHGKHVAVPGESLYTYHRDHGWVLDRD